MTLYQKIKGNFIRLDQLLKLAGLIETGGAAKQFIKNNELELNGTICNQRGKKILVGDKIFFKNKNIFLEVVANDDK